MAERPYSIIRRPPRSREQVIENLPSAQRISDWAHPHLQSLKA